MCNLQVVPSNIPAEAMRVYLQDNVITLLAPGVFSHLWECQSLHLERNKISSIYEGSFIGLRQLHQLHLDGNPIIHISEGSLNHLQSIGMISLKNVHLQILHPSFFVNLPRFPLQLALSGHGSKWNCKSLCWLKYEEYHKTVVWKSQELPTCRHGKDWNSLQCGQPGESGTVGKDLSFFQCANLWKSDCDGRDFNSLYGADPPVVSTNLGDRSYLQCSGPSETGRADETRVLWSGVVRVSETQIGSGESSESNTNGREWSSIQFGDQGWMQCYLLFTFAE